jgi:multidrug efflux pump subunit AcrA (membrane-fusion protein)
MATGFRRFLLSVVLIIMLLVGGIMIAGWLHATKPPAERSSAPPLPPLVRVQTVVRQDVPEFFVGYGTARADEDAVLAAEVPGVVVEVADGLKDGVHVEAGQLLVHIDDRQYQQQLARAEATADDVKANLEQLDVEKANITRLADIAEQEVEVNRTEVQRLGGLFEEEHAASKEYDFARLALQQSRRQYLAYRNQLDLIAPRRAALQAMYAARLAEVELARLDVERCRVTAPFAGEVVNVAVDPGDHLMIGEEIVRLLSMHLVEVPIELPASVRPRVKAGAGCTLEADTLPGTVWEGVVARIAPLSDEKSRTFAAYIEVDNDSQETPLVPGQFLVARVEGPVWTQVVAVPRGAIVGDHVYAVNDDVVHSRKIRITREVGEEAIVTGELEPGDRLVLTNLDVLADGVTVRVETHPPGAPPPVPPGGIITAGGGS